MMMKRILQCVLISLAVALAGCAPSDTGATESTNNSGSVASNSRGNAAANAEPAPTVSPRNTNPRNSNSAVTGAGGRETSSSKPSPTEEPKPSTGNADTPAAQATASAGAQTDQNAATQSKDQSPNKKAGTTNTDNTDDTDWNLLSIAAAVAAGVLALTLLGMGVQYVRKQSRRNLETHIAKVAGAQLVATKEGQKEIVDKLTAMAGTEKEMVNGLVDLHTEVRSLSRLVRESLSDRNDRRAMPQAVNYPVQMQDTSPKDEPEFPVSANDYLGKMDRYANVVRPDFQNGILVNDPEGKGELMLIRDSRFADDTRPLFVVPRATQFQTKQDFYTYYEKYYDCVRPSAGDVWILGPAVVEKVTGGWRLREKGMLEIR